MRRFKISRAHSEGKRKVGAPATVTSGGRRRRRCDLSPPPVYLGGTRVSCDTRQEFLRQRPPHRDRIGGLHQRGPSSPKAATRWYSVPPRGAKCIGRALRQRGIEIEIVLRIDARCRDARRAAEFAERCGRATVAATIADATRRLRVPAAPKLIRPAAACTRVRMQSGCRQPPEHASSGLRTIFSRGVAFAHSRAVTMHFRASLPK